MSWTSFERLFSINLRSVGKEQLGKGCHRGGHLQMFFKIGVLKSFSNFAGKQLKTCNFIKKRIQHICYRTHPLLLMSLKSNNCVSFKFLWSCCRGLLQEKKRLEFCFKISQSDANFFCNKNQQLFVEASFAVLAYIKTIE